MKPKIIKGRLNKDLRESGCCFTSCGGVPRVQQNDPVKIYKESSIKKILKKIK